MLGNTFLCKLVNNFKNLSTVFDEIYLADSSIIINKDYVIYMARGRRNWRGAPNVAVNQVEGTRGWNGVTNETKPRGPQFHMVSCQK